ncbi:ABC transporter substrate-binding protein [Wenxinia saemankumensis]|uniref:Peptide/nickel transport system substrate-binding protein n=1 Tax=Wenxinia saemankumensis TaxID=1447782 RepID=A0A1M6A044_9RHOB|nr:ABC transporter substrate-binding protein [Wenxinia saemankumensis]SHI29874.1 peptide/nickel transport system substrate-binding protein [Wenxinia saemankumensis]
MTREAGKIHPAALRYAGELRAGTMDRREFLARATALGLSAPAAWGLAGRAAPAAAQGLPTARQGGTIRCQMSVRALKDTRTFDWSELGNLTRGTLEYLVEYDSDGTFRGMLLEGWEANEDASAYLLHVRPGVSWSNGEPFTAGDVARNIARWCDASVAGNSMAGRMVSLIDPATGRLRDGAVEVVDELTVRLTLSSPDITLVPGFSDYPAAIVPASYDPADTAAAIGTGPYRIAEIEPGVRAVLERVPGHVWWGTGIYGGPYLDRIEYLDYGTDPAAWLAAMEAGEVDMLYESVGDFIDALDALGFPKSEVVSMATCVIRPNQLAEVDGMRPYADIRVRRAIQLATDNAILLELGYGNRGETAENHHVGRLHPEYAPMPPRPFDPAAALALLEEAGMAAFEFELTSVDDDWLRNTTDAVGAMLRDAGFTVRRTILPEDVFAGGWRRWPFSATNWNHRPLGVQVHALAYRSGAAWNEFGWSNPDFDALLAQALSIEDAATRRETMARMEALIQEEGVTIQPYWRSLYRHYRTGLLGVDMHVSFEHHHYKWGLA